MIRVLTITILLFPVFLGGFIYIIFRTEKLIMFRWFEYLNLANEINTIKSFGNTFSFPDWFIYNLPDGLWVFSYTAISLEIWKNSITRYSIFWILIIPIAAILSELLQLLKIISGTFDFADIVSYLLGITLPVYLLKKFNSKI
jgi:hypothetical protein